MLSIAVGAYKNPGSGSWGEKAGRRVEAGHKIKDQRAGVHQASGRNRKGADS
jgi:hypothetical protein